MQKGSHLVCGMFMLVGAETKNNGLEERHVGPRQEKMVNAGHGVSSRSLRVFKRQHC